jgi:glycosyltransferase involved in cell wall biosynthesis
MTVSEFPWGYDLASLPFVRVRQNFSMRVTPKYRPDYEQDDYAAFTADVMSRVLKRAQIFVDVGAHCGFFTLLAASANPELEIVAIEPTPETFSILECNAAQLQATRVTLHQVAASDAVGVARGIEAETSTVDALLQTKEPCSLIVRIDTEGHELAVLRGMAETLRRFEDLTLMIEFNPKMRRAADERPERLLEELERLGFEIFLFHESLRRAYRIKPTTLWSELIDSESCANLYCVRRPHALSLCLFAHTGDLGGAERSLLELVDELVADHGVICSVVVPFRGPLVETLERVGASCIVSEYAWWCKGEDDQRSDAEMQQRMSSSIVNIIEDVCPTLVQIDPDVIWTQTLTIPWGAVAASLTCKPHVWSICEYGEKDHGLKFVWPFGRVVADIAQSSDLIYANSRGVADYLFQDMLSDRVRVLYRHISISSYHADDVRPSFFRRANAVKLGIFATVAASKGQEDIILATAELVTRGRNAELLIAGGDSGPYCEHLRVLATQLQIADRVHFCGLLADPYPAMEACDVVVICSRNEAFGRVAVEAMLLCKPVVYPAAGAFMEYMIDGETGLSYPSGDIVALASRLEELIDDPDQRRSLGERAGADAAQRFTRERYGREAYQALVDLRSRVPASRSMPTVLASAVANTIESLKNRAAELSAIGSS